MSNLQPLKWSMSDFVDELEANSLTHSYSVLADEGSKFKVAYYLLSGGTHTKCATGFATIDDAKKWCWDHYNEEVQPYVKPSPTWIDASKQLPQIDRDRQFICAYDSALYPFSRVVWFNADIGKFDYQHDDVLAWMPIPEFSTMQNLHKGE